MRQLARFDDEERARTLADALLVEGIESRVDRAREGGFLLWVHDEVHLDRARELHELFQLAPDDPRFGHARREASTRRKERAREADQARERVVNVRARWTTRSGIGMLSLALIVISAGVFILTYERFGGRSDVARWLYIDSHGGLATAIYGHFSDVLSGQVWRLVTPVFMHGGILHLVFNLWWLKDLGTLVEHRQSSRFLLLFFLVVAIASNIAQYLHTGPFFLGMSGVVYGLFGYIWIRGRFEPASGYGLAPSAVMIMLGFYVLCFTGLLGPIANTAHTVGLGVGAAWGFLAAKRRPRRR